MSSLKISFPDITDAAATITQTNNSRVAITGDEDFPVLNTVTGFRYNYFKFGTSSTSRRIEYNLGTGNTQTADHVIIARADCLQDAGVTVGYVNRSSNGTTWTTESTLSSFDSATLYGPNANDYIKTFTESSAYQWWEIAFTASGSTNFPLSKVYLGKFFDPGVEPTLRDWRIERDAGEEVKFISDNGTSYFGRKADPIYRIRARWEGVTDDLAAEFQNKIQRYSDRNPVFLYEADSSTDLLDSQTLIHCKITRAEVQRNFNGAGDLATIIAEFEEVVG